MAHAQQMTGEMRECIQNCLDCYSICVETAHHCLTMGGKHADPKHIGLLNNCAQICQTSAAFMPVGVRAACTGLQRLGGSLPRLRAELLEHGRWR